MKKSGMTKTYHDETGKLHTKLYIVEDENSGIYFSTELFTQLYKAIARDLINTTAIDEATEQFLNDTDLQNLFQQDKVKALTDLKRKYLMLAAMIEEKCNISIKSIQKENDDLKDTFIESIRKEEVMKQVDIIKLSTIAKNTLNNHSKNFIHNESIYNVRSFATWLKAYNYDKYLIFKEKYKERNK